MAPLDIDFTPTQVSRIDVTCVLLSNSYPTTRAPHKPSRQRRHRLMIS